MDEALPSTRAAALARLATFLPVAGRAYAARRNHDTGPGLRSNVSQLSPAIRRRLVSEAEVARAAYDAHGSAADKFVSEVAWRSYFRGWLELRPAIWRRYLDELERDTARLGREPGLARAYAQATAGTTGIDAFDSWARELIDDGYLHNHSRMNYASIWTFTLGLPWTLGAAHFYRHLLCACPAANTLNWRWVVGLQTAGKAYRANPATIREMSDGRHRVETALAKQVVALTEPPVPGPGALPSPVAPGALRSGLFVTTEDLSIERVDLAPAEIVAVAGVDRIRDDASEGKRAHAEAALNDGLVRAGEHFGRVPERLDGGSLADALVGWAEAHGLDQVVTAYAPVGPVADVLAEAEGKLAANGVRLVRVLRAWDREAWPHAGRGFFQFRQAIPRLLALDGSAR